ncbi:PKD domain-containing protein [Pontibacter anaerobius]|uniref:PKD domain-containing protein n=1 Tax=Pontibacter anaerobius TaxID=2993940 RepID=A0ABT3RFH4_9BACT|nr:PKD domain-containing protein [Pontibacter anaerobius]MCX2739990.1 PKD domain-containing protein [Pontibacter anaerobius]
MRYNIFISNIYSILAALLLTGMFTACTPEGNDAELAPAPSSEMVQFTATPSDDNANIITFTNQTPGAFKAIWDFGNGAVAEGQQVQGAFAVEGEYTVKLTVFTSGGYAMSTKTITIAETNVSMLNREDYNFLTGGADDADGKTWVIEKEFKGHLGIGDATAPTPTPNWWSAGPNEKAGVGLYDDEMTFKLEGFSYTYKNNGDTYSNKDYASELGGTNASQDVTVSYTPPTNQSWSITEEGGKKYLTLSNNGFLGYYVGVNKYQILTLGENELYLMSSQKGVPGNAWFYRLVPKGYTRPVEPRQMKAIELEDTFDTDGNVTWKKETLSLNESYDNPAPVPINESAKVAMYVKQAGREYEFANMFADYAYNFDLTQKSVIKLKVLVPAYNDFVTAEGEDWANKNLLPQVSVKLQDGTAAQPWANQVEIKHQVESSQYGKWVELTFDFSAFAERKDLNRIVIQIGGEGNFIPGIFFIDDIQTVAK